MIMKYFKELAEIFGKIEVTDGKCRNLSLEDAICDIASSIGRLNTGQNKVICVGNGGSCAIASHTVTDLLKNAKVPAITISDASLLTCLSNDLGYENVFQTPIDFFAKKGDMIFAISSSGESKNILNAAAAAKEKGCFLVTLSGFKKGNILRSLGDANFYVPSKSYGYVELAHSIICHSITDCLMKLKGG